MMLSRLLPKAKPSYAQRLLCHFSSTSQLQSQSHPLSFPRPNPNPNPHFTSLFSIRLFSTNHSNNGGDQTFTSSNDNLWNVSGGVNDELSSTSWLDDDKGEGGDDVFAAVDDKAATGGDDDNQQWTLDDEATDDKVFEFASEEMTQSGGDGSGYGVFDNSGRLSEEEKLMLQKEEKELLATLNGPDRAFGDLIEASGITDEMLDSLMALKDFEGVEGLPPLTEIEDMRYEKNTRKSTRAEIELQKQEEIAKSRVRQVDEKGRAYGTGRRKCSVARVWVEPGHGNFLVNDKQFDVYFPMLDHRAALLRPFAETKTLGLWDIHCTVKGGGVSGQVGAIQLGISRALQNWEPGLRPPLRNAGFLTRDPRVVERKKPGKAKARKSFQWVKR